ncbi:MAG: hypothetical protein Q9M36_01080, partial [Sulfurovum sp.]|nr:hypothetical protein [Sulfurovum sp.]
MDRNRDDNDANSGVIEMHVADHAVGASNGDILQFRSGNLNSIHRSVNLSTYGEAILEFKMVQNETGNSPSQVVLEVSNDNGTSYTILETYNTDINLNETILQSKIYDISNYISSNTIIRFRTTIADTADGEGDYYEIDDLEIRVEERIFIEGSVDIENNLTATSYTVPANTNLNLTFQVTVDTPISLAQITNTATLNADGLTERNATVIDPMVVLIGHLYNDINGNGTQDGGESNLANIDVVITDANGTVHVVSTGADGDYTAYGLAGGIASVDINESDIDFPLGATQTEGTDPTNVTVIVGNNIEENNGFFTE